jgi:ribonuclease E
MTKKLLIDASHAEETRVVLLDGNRLEDFDVETATRRQIKGNIYLAKVIRVEPSLQAAFVEYGGNRHGFLAFGEIHPDYYQIPVADRQRLLAMAAAAAEEEAEAENSTLFEDLALDGVADTIVPEAEVVEVATEYEAAPEQEAQSDTAQPLAVTSIDIISAPPPLADESEADAAQAEPERELADGESGTEYVPGEAAEPRPTEFSESEAETLVFERGESAGDANGGEEDSEYAPPQPAPENLGGDGDDAAEAREQRQRQRFLRNYKIQEVIHRRQIMLIQVVKEERGNKGAALTTYLSLAGRFSVLMPNSPTGGGVSRKITSVADRRRLKEAVSELDIPQGMGLIVRTAGANRPKPEIKRDCEYLLRLWDDIRERTLQSVAPALIYEEASLIKRTIRDVYTRDVDDVFVDGEEGYTAARDFMTMLMPSHAKKVQLWSEGQPLFAKYQVEAQLDAMLNPIVQLRSGGYIVINQTEALVAIDVNSGRSTRERNIEDTALRTNMEAAEEVARQLRMRDLAGLIVIDFIDMESRKNNAMVERKLKDALKNDRARIQIGSISHFGLMEMSRQRLRPSLAEASLITCPHCAGMGHVRSPESAALHILRAVEDEGSKYRSAEILVTLPPDVALYLFNHKRDRLSAIETRYGMRVIFNGDASLTAANFRIEKIKALTAPPPVAAPAPQISRSAPEPRYVEPRHAKPIQAEPLAADADDDEDSNEAADAASGPSPAGETAEEGERRRRRRRRRRGRRTEPGAAPGDAAPEGVAGEPALQSNDAAPTGFAPRDDDQPTEMDLILAAELGDPAELGAGSELLEPVLAEPDLAGPDLAEPEKPARRRRSRVSRRRTGAAPAEGQTLPETPAGPAAGQSEIVYADIADIFEAAERAEEAQRVKTHLVVAPESVLPAPEPEPEQAAPQVPEAALEPVAHAVFEPAEAAPEPLFADADAPASEPALPAPEVEAPSSVPLVKPVLIGAEQAPVEKKRGWWRK